MDYRTTLPIVVVLIAGVVAATTDLWKFKIPNLLTLPLLASGLLFHLATGGFAGFGRSLLGALFGFAVLLVLHLAGGMGAGDVKFLAAVGSWLGVSTTLRVFLYSALAAGLYAVVLMLATGRLVEMIVRFQLMCERVKSLDLRPGERAAPTVQAELSRVDRRKRLVPFGAMVAVGLLATLATA